MSMMHSHINKTISSAIGDRCIPVSQAAACDGTSVTTSATGQEFVPGTLPIY